MLAVASLLGLDRHEVTGGHPECQERLHAAVDGLRWGVPDEMISTLTVTPAPADALRRVHDATYLAVAERACQRGIRALDPDTPISHGSWDTAVLAAGAGLDTVAAIDAGQARRGFVLARPPGHHATPNRAMGFCLINNVAVTAGALRARGERVLIVDWDVHHGNGTQDIFWNEPGVLFVSIHQAPPQYPGTGTVHETGGQEAAGRTINVPLPPGATGDAFRQAVDEVVAPAAAAFDPTWLLISAGFDAHREDPLADLMLTSADYGDLTRRLLALVPSASGVVAFLEGGYDLQALHDSVGVTAAALAGLDAASDPAPEPRSSGGPGHEAVLAALRAHEAAVQG
jgi:acetoin utilization deacetylase AcuC-like enzyme